jgi:diadenylate cyclase
VSWLNALAHLNLNGFGVSDFVDIVATSILAYYLLLLIRGTRAVQIMLGLFVLVVVLAISNLLHLLVLATIMQYVLLGTAVTLPIVFQPELRRGLEQIGRGRFFPRAPGEHDDEIAAEQVGIISDVAFVLARGRVGALIVLEQQTGLREYVESGTALDARLSAELLLALFNKSSPLHDGAVIIRDLTVEGAACFLPLSENALSAERHIGTRHRAAVGLSEQTDAVVVVVSEESGSVSVARAGRLSVQIDDVTRLNKVLSAIVRPARRVRTGGENLIAAAFNRILRAVDRSQRSPT